MARQWGTDPLRGTVRADRARTGQGGGWRVGKGEGGTAGLSEPRRSGRAGKALHTDGASGHWPHGANGM